MIQLGDIKQINGGSIPFVDAITGGSPCQNLSTAGNRKGLAGEESGLFLEQVRVVREMREASNGEYPRYMVWENVTGAFSSNEGRDFQKVLTEIIRITEPEAPDVPMPDGGGDGQKPDASILRWADGPLPGGLTTRNFGECPSVGRGSHLSQILEDSAQPKYYLSQRACQGIMNRAEKKGKVLPEILKAALEKQAGYA